MSHIHERWKWLPSNGFLPEAAYTMFPGKCAAFAYSCAGCGAGACEEDVPRTIPTGLKGKSGAVPKLYCWACATGQARIMCICGRILMSKASYEGRICVPCGLQMVKYKFLGSLEDRCQKAADLCRKGGKAQWRDHRPCGCNVCKEVPPENH